IPHNELATIHDSMANMLKSLDDAAKVSADPPDMIPLALAQTIHTGQCGRPRVEIDPNLLETALSMRGPTQLATLFNCVPRTVRHCTLEQNLVEPGPPVYVDYTDEDRNSVHLYTATSRDQSGLTDEQLDTITQKILKVFPLFSRRMIDSHMKYLGHRVPRRMIEESYLRLIHWRIIFHAFIDGFSCFITGVRASNNNRAETVLNLFLEIIEEHDTPSQVREGWDMVHTFGGSKNMSPVYNVCIERLWWDLTSSSSSKWKQFFQDLEHHDGLNP
ncbi:hypothetical protein PAXRUDRAFT_95342, partial [Paxillus rubicundulus Ve08.2h10]